MNNAHIEKMVTINPSWPCLVVAVFRWNGTDCNYYRHFNSETAFRDFQREQAERLTIQDYFYHRAHYLAPRVRDLNETKPTGELHPREARRLRMQEEEREAWDRYYSKHKNQ